MAPHFRTPIRLFPLLALLTLAALPLSAQRRTSGGWTRDCDRWNDREHERYCTTEEVTIPSPRGTLVVDGRANGGINVIGTNRRDVLVIAKIQSNARSEERAEAIARQIRIRTEDGRVTAEGPETRNNEWWSVSFEIEVPAQSDLELFANNGGIAVAEVTGTLRMETRNGGIHLEAVNGDVTAFTTNGGLQVILAGDTWIGKGLDATTTNGGVRLTLPRNYSARLETGTRNGGIDIDFPVTVQGRLGRHITTDLGRGGPLIRVITTNGGVDVRRG